MSRSKKRASKDLSDSDDDSDDDLFTSPFATSKSSKRRVAKDEEAKKKKRMAQMSALLDSGRVKLERENRMEKLCQENIDLMRDESLDGKKNGNCIDEGNNCTDGNSSLSRENSSSLQRPYQDIDVNYFQHYEPKDSKETSCLGSRSTLQFSRVIPIQTTHESSSPHLSDEETRGFSPYWFGLEQAMTDLCAILSADRQKQQRPSSFESLREELLQLCSAKSPRACVTYLRKMIMSKQENQERVRRIDIDLLRWLMAMACGPVINGCINGRGENNKTKTESMNEKRKPKNLIGNKLASQKLFRDAQTGAYQTLHRLWSQDLGFPLQQHHQNEMYLLSIAALPRQLRQWFGSSFSVEKDGGQNAKNSKTEERNGSTPTPPARETTDSTNQNNNNFHCATSSHSALVRFLQLWALVLQQQNKSDETGDNVHLVQFHCNQNRAGLRNDISDAIVAVLWAGLNPSFASSISAKNDGNRSIQTIVACLLDRGRREDDNKELFGEWLQSLSERICMTWSKNLGRGRMGTDAYEDEYAWLSLARTATRLVCVDSGSMQGQGDGECIVESYLKDFQLNLCRCILMRAFGADNDGQKLRNVGKSIGEELSNSDGKSDDWISRLMDEEIQRMEVPFEICSTQRWQTMALAVVGVAKLASSFSEIDASKCFAIMDICTVCFQSATVELEDRIRKHCPKEKEGGVDDNEDTLISKEDGATIASSGVKNMVLEKQALYNAFVRLENVSEIVSNQTRELIMQNVFFPWSSHMAESLRNYARWRGMKYAPLSATNGVGSVKRQSTISTFFKSNKSSGELITS